MSSSTEIKSTEGKLIDQITAQVTSLQQSGEIHLPKNYSAENNLKSAWLMLQDQTDKSGKPVLEVCTKASIASAMLKMVIQGLSAVKNQCYFIPYGNKLNMQRSYQGSIALSKRVGEVKEVNANVIYEGDTYETEINEDGIKRLIRHQSPFENRNDDKIKGVYAVVIFNDGTKRLEEMTFQEVLKSWMQGQTNGNSPAHKNFKGEMCKKTVINRALKTVINSSSDSDLYDDDELTGSQIEHAVKSEIKEKANKVDLAFDEPPYAEEVDEKPKQPVKEEKEVKNGQAVLGPSFE